MKGWGRVRFGMRIDAWFVLVRVRLLGSKAATATDEGSSSR
jgi:hypothetical protein